jgi:hypothetical protein
MGNYQNQEKKLFFNQCGIFIRLRLFLNQRTKAVTCQSDFWPPAAIITSVLLSHIQDYAPIGR